MSGLPFVSVVIPVFDRADVLEVVLRFFKFQTYAAHSFEVIVVDDGSAESIGAALDPGDYEFALEVLIQPNRGRAAARNAGIAKARGELVLFCDADRIPAASWVAAHVRFHESHERCAAVGVPWDCFCSFPKMQRGGLEMLDAMHRRARLPAYFQAVGALFADECSRSPVSWAAFLVGNSSVRHEDLVRAGGFDPELTRWGLEHFELALRLVERHSMSICHAREAANLHVPHARSLEHFRSGIQDCTAVLARKHPGREVHRLQEFLFGEISLQQFELYYGGSVSPALGAAAPIYFTQLRAAQASQPVPAGHE